MWAMKRKTIRNHEDFLTKRDDLFTRSQYFFVKAKTAKYADSPRYGLVVPKRIFKHAVDRNRAKRLLREWLSHYENRMMNDFDYIFIALPDILGATRDSGYRAMRRAMMHIRRNNKFRKINARRKKV